MSSVVSQLSSMQVESLIPVFGLLIDTALKGSLLIAAAATAAYLLRGRSAAARHVVWTAAVIGHLALPVLTLLVPQWRIPILPAPPWLDIPAAVAPPAAIQTAAINAARPLPARSDASPAVTTPAESDPSRTPTSVPSAPPASSSLVSPSSPSSLSLLGLLWILGTTVVLLRLAIGTWRVGRLAKHGDRVDDGEWLSLTQRLANRLGITRPLILLRGDSLAVPVTWGVVYPAVLLPPDSTEWPEARRRFVLVHEMAHVKRFDALTQLLAQVTIAIFWFDPLIWFAAHRMRVEREHACDDYVLRDGTVPSLYAGELLEMVQSIGSPRHESAAPAFAALAMARRSEFEGRMLAILDPRQDRHTLGRRSVVMASVALAFLVLPLAALRPFETSGGRVASTQPSPPVVLSKSPAITDAATPGPAAAARTMSDIACDSLRRVGGQVLNHVNLDRGEDGGHSGVIEFLTIDESRCAQAAVFGEATFANDRLLSLPEGAYASFREVSATEDRRVTVTSETGGALRYRARLNGVPVAYDDNMRSWMARFVPQMLTETAVDAPQRVSRYMARGGVDAVLTLIGGIKSPASKRAHYSALLDGKPLTEAEYDRVSRHATRTLSGSASDLSAVLTRIAASPATGTKSLGAAIQKIASAQQAMGKALGAALKANDSSGDSAHTLTQYASTDDPQMILLALRGAKKISSSTDKRILLQTVAARALRRNDAGLRHAFFDAAATVESDTDLRIVLTSALPYGHADAAVTLAVFRLVAANVSSDTDKRLVLSTAVEQGLLTSRALREAFMAAANSIQSSTDYTTLMRSALKK